MKTIYFDVDDTLIIWPQSGMYNLCKSFVEIEDIVYGVHEGHIKRLKQLSKAGDKIVVWSASGENWAMSIVEILGLQDFVDIILEKPAVAYDDKIDLGTNRTHVHYLHLDGGYMINRDILK